MTEEKLFDLETPTETSIETPAEPTAEAPPEKAEDKLDDRDEQLIKKIQEVYSELNKNNKTEEDLRAKENERLANRVRLEQRSDALGMSREWFNSQLELISNITKKDGLDSYEEMNLLLNSREIERANKLEEAHKETLARDSIIERRWGTDGKKYMIPKISEKLKSASGVDIVEFAKNNMTLSAQEEFFSQLVSKDYERREEIEHPKEKPRPTFEGLKAALDAKKKK